MPNNESKKEYIFALRHVHRLQSILKSRSFVFNIDYRYKNFSLAIPEIKETQQVVGVPIIRITTNATLLPRHCKLALIEESLAYLEEDPENVRLLALLGKYTESNLFEWRGYHYGVKAGLAIITFSAVVALLLGFAYGYAVITFSFIPVLLVAFSLMLLNEQYPHNSALKFIRWVENLIKGFKREVSANIKAFENDLTLLISESKAKETVGETRNEQANQLKEDGTETPQVNEKSVTTQPLSSYSSIFTNHVATSQDAVNNNPDIHPCAKP